MTVSASPSARNQLALITGSGASSIDSMRRIEPITLDTPHGPHSPGLAQVEWHGRQLLHLPRHGAEHNLAPHLVNYRANLWALQHLGVSRVLALGAVGGIREDLIAPGSLVVPDQLIDYTWGRDSSFFDGATGELQHIDFTLPFTAGLRKVLLAAAQANEQSCVNGGVYGVTQGPRLETAAEIERLQRDGCDLVGMTAMPEAVLARELGIEYGFLAVVVNAAAGRGSVPITDEFEQQMARAVGGALKLLSVAVGELLPD